MNARQIASSAIITLVLMMLAGAAYLGNFGWEAESRMLKDYVGTHPLLGAEIMFLAGMLFTAAGGSRQLVAAIFGFVMGATAGAVLVTLATLAGAALCFGTARYLLRRPTDRQFPPSLLRAAGKLRHHTFLTTLSIRLLPVGSNLMTNLFAATLRVRAAPFLAASLLGYLPQSIIFALAGDGIATANEAQLAVSAVLTIVSVLLAIAVFKSRSAAMVSPPG